MFIFSSLTFCVRFHVFSISKLSIFTKIIFRRCSTLPLLYFESDILPLHYYLHRTRSFNYSTFCLFTIFILRLRYFAIPILNVNILQFHNFLSVSNFYILYFWYFYFTLLFIFLLFIFYRGPLHPHKKMEMTKTWMKAWAFYD